MQHVEWNNSRHFTSIAFHSKCIIKKSGVKHP